MPAVQRGFGRLYLSENKLSHYLLFCPTVIKYQQGVLEMKKKDVIDLIRYHTEENDAGFRNVAYQVADEFYKDGDASLSEYIISLLSDASSFVPQESIKEYQSKYLEKIPVGQDMLLLPDAIMQDMYGIVHAISHHIGIHRFLFQGAPGTGKTEAVKQLAKVLNRELYMVNFNSIIDSKLGQTQKNMAEMFQEIVRYPFPERLLVLFDEIDAIALDRTNSNDLREMGRATSALLKQLDHMSESVVLIATTNLFSYFDKALVRRFDSVIDFNRYTEEDLIAIAEKFLEIYLRKMKIQNRDVRLCRKILRLGNPIPYPGDLKNMIRTSLAFSDPEDSNDYFKRLYESVCHEAPKDLVRLKEQGFTVREMEKLTNASKSSVSRKLNRKVIHHA